MAYKGLYTEYGMKVKKEYNVLNLAVYYIENKANVQRNRMNANLLNISKY